MNSREIEMRTSAVTLILTALLVALALPAAGRVESRTDAIWAKRSLGPIVLDGVLNEADWAQAESWVIRWA